MRKITVLAGDQGVTCCIKASCRLRKYVCFIYFQQDNSSCWILEQILGSHLPPQTGNYLENNNELTNSSNRFWTSNESTFHKVHNYTLDKNKKTTKSKAASILKILPSSVPLKPAILQQANFWKTSTVEHTVEKAFETWTFPNIHKKRRTLFWLPRSRIIVTMLNHLANMV